MQEITKLETNAVTSMSDFVQIKDEQVYTTSRIVAEKFGKEHKHVIRDIEELIKNMVQPIENINQPKFGLVKNDYFIADGYLDAKGETRKQYLITEKGTMLLIMGFTGEKAFSVKLKFISEFKRMKEYIRTLEANPIERILANSTNQLETARAITQMLEIEAKKQEVLIAQNKLKTLLTLKIRSVKPSLITASDAEQANNGINRSIRQVQTDNRANATKQISQSGFTPKQTQNFLSKLFHCLFSQPSCLIR